MSSDNPEGLCYKCRTAGCPERFNCPPFQVGGLFEHKGLCWRQSVGMKKILASDEEDTFHDN